MFSYFDAQAEVDPGWPFIEAIARGRMLICYDGLGSGLSDRSFVDLSIEQSVADLLAVIDSAGVERISMFASMSGTQAALAFAARHPQRVESLLIYCGPVRGFHHRDPTAQQAAEREAMLSAFQVGWDSEAFRLLNVNEGAPDATLTEQRASAAYWGRVLSGPAFVKGIRAQMEADLSEAARRVRCRTLVMHPRRCTRVPFEEGRRLASLIPGARFLPVEGANWSMMKSDPQFESVVAVARAFLREGEPPESLRDPHCASFTPREREVLGLLARGLDNLQIAAHLGLSEKTVRNHITPIFDKLGVENRAQAIVRAREAGLGEV